MVEKTFQLDQLVDRAYRDFCRSWSKADAFYRTSWQLSESVSDVHSLPPLPAFLNLNHSSDDLSDFLKSDYKKEPLV